jgi:hypothetical protein
MGPEMTASERAVGWPHLPGDWQRRELERRQRSRVNALMTGAPFPRFPSRGPLMHSPTPELIAELEARLAGTERFASRQFLAKDL